MVERLLDQPRFAGDAVQHLELVGSPAAARSSQLRHAARLLDVAADISAHSVNAASRSQQ